MINYERVAEKIFAIIKGHGHTLSMYKEDGMDTTDAAEARRFFVATPNYMITLEEETSTIKINKNSDLELEDLEGIMKQMKNVARENMLNTQVKVFGKEITPKDFAYQAKKFKDKNMSGVSESKDEWGKRGSIWDSKGQCKKCKRWPDGFDPRDATYGNMCEYCNGDGFDWDAMNWSIKDRVTGKRNKIRSTRLGEASLSRMTGSKKTSYQTLESVKMVVRHRKAVDEDVRGSRSRQIKAIFLEQGGERFRFPHNCLPCARAMARHMYEGGTMRDSVGEYIIESSGNMLKLKEFIRYTRTNKLINETSEDIIKIVKENVATISMEFKRLTGAKSYHAMSEAIAARETNVLEEDDTDLQDMFTVRKFDEKFGAILPLVSRLLSEKQAWRAALLEASKQTIFMKAKEDLAEEDIMEFENPMQQVGYKIGKVAKRMVESGDLSNFVAKVAGKLIEGAKISEFEQTIVRNVMENAKLEEVIEDDYCAKCGEDMWGDCKCENPTPENTIESISDAYELKLKMIEHEELFTEDRTLANPYTPPPKRECSECGDFASYLTDRHENDLHYTCDTCGHEEDDRMVDLNLAGEIEEDAEAKKTACSKCNGTGREPGESDGQYDRKIFSAVSCKACGGYGYGLSGDPARGLGKVKEGYDDHHAGEVEAGAHSGMPEVDNRADCETCQGWGEVDGDPIGLCPSCDGSGKAPYDKGSKQDPFGGNYGVDVEDYMVGGDVEGTIRR